jgi:hypothetical protein
MVSRCPTGLWFFFVINKEIPRLDLSWMEKFILNFLLLKMLWLFVVLFVVFDYLVKKFNQSLIFTKSFYINYYIKAQAKSFQIWLWKSPIYKNKPWKIFPHKKSLNQIFWPGNKNEKMENTRAQELEKYN